MVWEARAYLEGNGCRDYVLKYEEKPDAELMYEEWIEKTESRIERNGVPDV